MGKVSESVCPWQVFLAWSNICRQGQEPTLERSTWKVIYSGMFHIYLQALDYTGKACYGQAL
jgi:hypothetical protein